MEGSWRKKDILEDEKPVIDFAYACVVAIKDIHKGEALSLDNIWVKKTWNWKKYLQKILKTY